MALIIYKNSETLGRLKATIQRTGRLGFSDATAKALDLANVKAVQFAGDNEDPEVMYLINNTSEEDEKSFRVYKSGQYYHVNTRALFSELGVDYENFSVIFDLTRDKTFEDMEVYRMKKRILPRKNKEEQNNN